MGLNLSTNNVANSVDELNYFSIQMDLKDRFRLILAPDQIIKATHAVLSLTWSVQSVLKKHGLYVEV